MIARTTTDRLTRGAVGGATVTTALFFVAVIGALVAKAFPVLQGRTIASILFSVDWKPLSGSFGLLPFIAGTLWVTVLAMVAVVPIGLLAAIYLAEYAGSRARSWLLPVIDLLAGIPSVVFGLCGVLVVVPFVRDLLAPAVGVQSSGYCLLSGAVVLAVMVLPIVINMTVEIMMTVPNEQREAALSLGATRWEAIKLVVVRKAAPGIVVAVALGFGRALGETMAVLMVVGNVVRLPKGLLQPAYPLPALIANNYGEMLSVPIYESALMFGALVLLVLVLLFNLAARVVLRTIKRRVA